MKEKIDNLNIGSGSDILKDYINLDYKKGEGVDVVWDCNILPLPFKDNRFKNIRCFHVIEHLNNPYDFVLEMNRLLKKGGFLHCKLPTNSPAITHKRFYHTSGYFDVLCKEEDRIGNAKRVSFEYHSLFDKILVEGNLKNFKWIIGSILEKIRNLIFKEYEYILRKK